MTQERGGYCSIRRVLLDGPDFQQLTERARWVFVALKLNVGPSGIDVFYPSSLTFQLAAQTGAQPDDITDALAELEQTGWIVREGNVLWVVGHLKHDPHVKSSDVKHRKSVARHLSGLPRLAIVRAFVAAHPEFFPASDGPFHDLAWAIEGPSKGHRSREYGKGDGNGILKTEKTSAAGASVPRASWVTRVAEVWNAEVGRLAPGRIGADAKPLVDKHGEERFIRAMRAYITVQKSQAKNRTPKWAWFIAEGEVWIERTAAPLEVVDGEMTDTLELMTRPERMAS